MSLIINLQVLFFGEQVFLIEMHAIKLRSDIIR